METKIKEIYSLIEGGINLHDLLSILIENREVLDKDSILLIINKYNLYNR